MPVRQSTRYAGRFLCAQRNTTIGEVVGAVEPPAGSDRNPDCVPARKPAREHRRGRHAPRRARDGTSPAGRAPPAADEPKLVHRARGSTGSPTLVNTIAAARATRRPSRFRPAEVAALATSASGADEQAGDLRVADPCPVECGDFGEHPAPQPRAVAGQRRPARARWPSRRTAYLIGAGLAGRQVPLEPCPLGAVERVKRVRACHECGSRRERESRNPHQLTPRESRSRPSPSRIRVFTVPSATPRAEATCG